jgi:hypothetical protein
MSIFVRLTINTNFDYWGTGRACPELDSGIGGEGIWNNKTSEQWSVTSYR